MKTITVGSVVYLLSHVGNATTLASLQKKLYTSYETDDLKRENKPEGLTTNADFAVDFCNFHKGVQIQFVFSDIDLNDQFYWGVYRDALETMQDTEATICYSTVATTDTQDFLAAIQCKETKVSFWPEFKLEAGNTNGDLVWDVTRARLDDPKSGASGVKDLTMTMLGVYKESSQPSSYRTVECYEGRNMEMTTFYGKFEGTWAAVQTGKAIVDPPTTETTFTQSVKIPDFKSIDQRTVRNQIAAWKPEEDSDDDDDDDKGTGTTKGGSKSGSGAMMN